MLLQPPALVQPQGWGPGGGSILVTELGGEGYARVAPKLYMGSRPPEDPLLGTAFDVVVLCAQEYQPPQGAFGRAKIVRCPIDDAAPSQAESQAIVETGTRVASAVRQGRRTLVTCHAGLNRSGVVTAYALIVNGVHVREAIAMVRRARGSSALFNTHFVNLLRQLGRGA